MNYRIIILALQGIFISTAGFCADEIAINESRPLGKLATELNERYGYLVTYEEAPYSDLDLRVDLVRKDLPYHSPISKPVTFHLPQRASSAPGSANQIEPLRPELIHSLIREYQRSGNPGKFDALFDGEYAHIVPSGRMVGRRLEEFQPVLSTKVIISAQSHSCFDIFSELFDQILKVRGFNVVAARLPVNAYNSRQCVIEGTDLTARQVLTQILLQIGTKVVPGLRNTRFSWWFAYDANEAKYFLSTAIVPDLTGPSPEVTTKDVNPSEPKPQASPGAVSPWGVFTKPPKKDK